MYRTGFTGQARALHAPLHLCQRNLGAHLRRETHELPPPRNLLRDQVLGVLHLVRLRPGEIYPVEMDHLHLTSPPGVRVPAQHRHVRPDRHAALVQLLQGLEV